MNIIIFVVVCASLAVTLVLFAVTRIRHARATVQTWLEQAGYEIVQLHHRALRWGPYAWTTNQHSQFVYRIVVRTPDGRQRQGWVRWGRPWFWMADTMELRWDD